MILLSDVVAQTESAGNPSAMRYEPRYQPSSIGVANATKFATGGWIDNRTAQMICQTSWGKYQIMGDNLYNALGYQGTLVHYLQSPSAQLQHFELFIQKIGFENVQFSALSPEHLDLFAQKYNGSLAYVGALKTAYQGLCND